MDIIGRGLAKQMPELLDKMEQATRNSPELKGLVTRAKKGGGQWQGLLLGSIAGTALGGAASSSLLPPLELLKQEMSKLLSFQLTPISIALLLWYRKIIGDDVLIEELKRYGFDEKHIEYLKKSLLFYPAPQDLINWIAKEVYEPDMQATYGLADEFDKVDLEPFAKAGITEEQVRNFWIAHWNYPSTGQVFDMFHRGELKENDVEQYYRLAEIPPYWRKKLNTISWDLPNRIELRLMARYGLIDKDDLVKMLEYVGLHKDYRSISADMMLVMGIESDISTRYSKGWINADDVKSELSSAGLSEDMQERTYQRIVKKAATERVSTERDLTVTDIIKGVKKGTISRSEGQDLLIQMGYDQKEAKFKLDINIPEEETVQDTKQRELTKTDILSAYKLGQIDEAEAVSQLMSIRYSEDNATFLLGLTIATLEKIAEVRERDLTKADIIKAVKKGVISQEDAYLMLLNIGYDDSESIFILTINPTAEAGSPSTYNEFRVMAQSYRDSIGLPSKKITQEMIQAEWDYKAAQAALKTAKSKKASPNRVQELELAVEQAKQRYHQLTKET